MFDFLKTNLPSVITVILFIAVLVVLWLKGKKDLVRHIVLATMTEAEVLLGGGTGELKYSYVVNAVYQRLPYILKLFITTKQLDKYIESLVNTVQDYVDNGKLDGSFVPPDSTTQNIDN